MKKHLREYRWFQFYRANGIGLRVHGRTFYPLKRKARKNACRNCWMFTNSEFSCAASNRCDLGFRIEGYTPLEPCFPVYDKSSMSDMQAYELWNKIVKLCDREDWDDELVDDWEKHKGIP